MVFSRISTPVMAAILVMICIGTGGSFVKGQSEIPSCASKLVDCAQFINSTNPSATCCNSLKEAMDKEISCLCNLFNNPTLLRQFGIDVNQALLLPQHCGISGDVNICRASAPGSSVNPPPPATPGNGVGKIAGSGFLSMVLLWASLISLF